MSVTITTEPVTVVPDEPGVNLQDLVARWQRGDLSAARPLIDALGSTLKHVMARVGDLRARFILLQDEHRATLEELAALKALPEADRVYESDLVEP